MIGLRRLVAAPLARGIESARALGRSSSARRLAGAGVVLTGDRLWHRAGALGKSFIVHDVLREPVVVTERFGFRYLLFPSDAIYQSFLYDGYYERAEQSFCASYVKV